MERTDQTLERPQHISMGAPESESTPGTASAMPPEFKLSAGSFQMAQADNKSNSRPTEVPTPPIPNGMQWSEAFPHLVKITGHLGWTLEDVALTFYGTRGKADRLEITNNRSMRLGATQTPLPRNTEVRIQFDHLTLPWKRKVYTLLYIAPRSSWNARENRPHGNGYDYFEYENPAEALHSIAVHHTGNRSKLQNMNDLQDFHMDSEDKADIAYHYAINQNGEIIEGRPINIRGSHVDGRNTGVIGIVFLADLQTGPWLDRDGDNSVNSRMLNSAYALVAHLLGRFPNVTTLGGHQEYVNTECPGDLGQPYAEQIRSRFGLGIPVHSDSQASDGTGGHGHRH